MEIILQLNHKNQIRNDSLNYVVETGHVFNCPDILLSRSDAKLTICGDVVCPNKAQITSTTSDIVSNLADGILCGNKKIVKVLKKVNFCHGKEGRVHGSLSNNENCNDESSLCEKKASPARIISNVSFVSPMQTYFRSSIPSSTFVSDDVPARSDPTVVKTGKKDDEDVATFARIAIELAPLGLKTKDSDLSNFRCSKCLYQAFYSQQLMDHLLEQHRQEVRSCLCCPYVCFKSTDLQDHYKELHPRCYCEECGFVTKHGYILKRHKQSHSEEGRRCTECGKLYKDQYVLKMHMKMVHTMVEKSFKCELCAKEFNRKAHLKRHMKTHNPDKPFRCPYEDCLYRGSERSDINKHLLIHKEPKHECSICHRLFRHAKNRDLHAKRHTGDKDYKCGDCNFYGYTFTDVRKHIKRKHTKCSSLVFATEKDKQDHQCSDPLLTRRGESGRDERDGGDDHQGMSSSKRFADGVGRARGAEPCTADKTDGIDRLTEKGDSVSYEVQASKMESLFSDEEY